MNDYRKMWADLGLDLKRHDALLEALPAIYGEVYLSQESRPAGMEYFDFVVSEIHGARVKELVDHKAQGGKVIGTFCVYAPEEVIVAADAIGVGLCGGLDLTVPDGERVLPRNLCPLIKSVFGFKVARLCPYFEACDFVVGETTCERLAQGIATIDAKRAALQRLYDLRKADPAPMPASLPTPSGWRTSSTWRGSTKPTG